MPKITGPKQIRVPRIHFPDVHRKTPKIHRNQLPNNVENGCITISDAVAEKHHPEPIDNSCIIVDDDVTEAELDALRPGD